MPTEQGLRLDQFLAAATTLSRRAARRLVEEGAVRRNGQPARVQSRSLDAGDVIDVSRPGVEIGAAQRPTVAVPTVLLEDDWVLVADKPSGILSQPSESPDDSDLAFDQIMLLGIAARDGHRPYLRLAHRLDRHTSGVVLFGRAPKAMAPLTEAWASGTVDRLYFAVVEGHPEFDVRDLDRPIERDPTHDWRFVTGPGGRPAHTSVRVVDRLREGLAFVECRLLTGRTHQVRVHLAEAGHPVAGDRLYGGRRSTEAVRPLLHAAMLSFPHPRSGERRTVVCRPPADFDSFLTARVVARIEELRDGV
jgi:23S rRNA pseudouridine1911/1915/1917 synthase